MAAAGNGQLALQFSWDERLSLDDYVAGDNTELLGTVRRMAHGAGEDYLYLYGPPGLGKTHLLQGACRLAAEQSRPAAYLPLSEAVQWPVQALEGLESLGLVAVDEADALRGVPQWQEALFHLFNRIRDAGGQLLIAARGRPGELGLELPDLISRLQWGLVLRLQDLDDADKARILGGRAASRSLELPEEVARYLLARHRRDLHGLFELLDRLDTASLAEQRRLTVPFVKKVLGA